MDESAQAATSAASRASVQSPSVWDRVSTWASEHKAAVYTIAGITLVATGGVIYYTSSSSRNADGGPRKSKKERRKAKKEAQDSPVLEEVAPKEPKPAAEQDALPSVDESTVGSLSEQQRKDYAAKLKAAGNKAYASKSYTEAIELYGKAILCKPDPIFYSNRAACYNALSEWQKVIEDCTAAVALDDKYVKALNRRANAYEQTSQYSEALLDYTASCIIDDFRNQSSADSVERCLKRVAEAKAKGLLANKGDKLPSSMFITNFLQSFRAKPLPKELEAGSDVAADSGKGQLRRGVVAIGKRSPAGYEEASEAFSKAIELGGLDSLESFAYNMRGTFKYLRGDTAAALDDLTKSVALDQSNVQSYIKRASLHLENGSKEDATADFETALAKDDKDPDVYYHRAQLHFILGEFTEAAGDYQKSIDLDKDFVFSYIQLGVTHYKMGSTASSMATFRKCRKAFPQNSEVYNYYGELLLDQQKYQEAIEQFDSAVEIEQAAKDRGMNVLPLINKALAVFQWKQDFVQAEQLCQKALDIDSECDIAVATLAQLMLQQGKVSGALKYFERAAELGRTEGEIVNALSYAEATRTQLEVQEKYPQLATKLQAGGAAGFGAGAVGA